MAISISEQYPGKTAGNTTNYPLGEARNVTTPGDGTGTPWEQAIVNDDQGFKQALLAAAGLTPSGTPDTALVSQYLQAVRAIIKEVSYGVNRAYQNVTASRAVNTTYTNNEKYPIDVCITRVWGAPGQDWVTVLVGGVTVYDMLDEGDASSWRTGISFRVPPGATYRVNSGPSGSIARWMEL